MPPSRSAAVSVQLLIQRGVKPGLSFW